MPVLLYLLALAVFAQGTSEFVLAGLLPALAEDLGVPLARAGLLTYAFALGMVVGAPAMAALLRRLSPRWALGGFLAAFVLAHVVGARTDRFEVLLATRVVASSSLGVVSRDRNGRILEICARLDAGTYLSGAGGRKYNDPTRFAEAGIALEYLDFTPPEYPQLHGAFVPNLGVLDALFNIGPDTRRLLG